MTEKPRRGRPPIDPNDVRNRTLPAIRVNTEEEAALKDGAKAEGKGLSEWLRDLGIARAKRVLRSQ